MANGCTFFGPKDREGTSCCNEHDRAYVTGAGKFSADWQLLKCQIAAGHPVQGFIMWLMLTVFGWPLYLKYRLRDRFGWFPKKN